MKTGERWAEVVVRPLMFGLYSNSIFVAVFFVSFILLTQIVLTNLVVSLLLDKSLYRIPHLITSPIFLLAHAPPSSPPSTTARSLWAPPRRS